MHTAAQPRTTARSRSTAGGVLWVARFLASGAGPGPRDWPHRSSDLRPRQTEHTSDWRFCRRAMITTASPVRAGSGCRRTARRSAGERAGVLRAALVQPPAVVRARPQGHPDGLQAPLPARYLGGRAARAQSAAASRSRGAHSGQRSGRRPGPKGAGYPRLVRGPGAPTGFSYRIPSTRSRPCSSPQ